MKKWILIIAGTIIYSNIISQQIPSCLRLKDITSSIKIGAFLQVGSGLFSGISSGPDTAGYRGIARREYDIAQSAFYPNWGGWTGQYTYDFSNLDKIVNWATANGKIQVLHTPIAGADMYLPDWFKNGTWTNAQMDTLIKKLIYALMDHNNNKSKFDMINVCNELFEDDGTYRPMKLSQLGWETDASGLSGVDKVNTQHPVFVGKVFQYFRQKTNAKLELRDYNNEIVYSATDPNMVKKQRAFYQLLKHMLNKSYPIDAVGIQAHYYMGVVNDRYKNNDLRDAILKFKAAGVDANITEFDIGQYNNASPGNYQTWSPVQAQQQRQDYYNITKQILEGGAQKMMFWGTQDRDPNWRTYENHMLFDSLLNVKPAYYGVQQALLEAASKTTVQTGFYNMPFTFPGRLQVENYDNNCTGSAYSDIDVGNNGNAKWRDDDVDISTAGTGNYIIGWNAPGEWREYTVNLPNGTYAITTRVGTVNSDASMIIKLGNGPDGNTFSALATISIPNTGAYSTFQNVVTTNVLVSNGGSNKVLRLETLGNYFDIDWIEFSSVATGMKNKKEAGNISVFPNPASEEINVQLLNKVKESIPAQLMDISGRILHEYLLDFISSTSQQVTLSNLPSGIYLLKIQDSYFKVVKN